MASEVFSVTHTSSRTVYFSFFKPSALHWFDFSTSAWTATPTNKKAAATATVVDADESIYTASVDVALLNNTGNVIDLVVLAYDDLATDEEITSAGFRCQNGRVVEGASTLTPGTATSPMTFAELYADLLRSAGLNTSVAANVTLAKAYVNNAYREFLFNDAAPHIWSFVRKGGYAYQTTVISEMTADGDVPMGGVECIEVLRQACRAVWERNEDGIDDGPEHRKYQTLLKAAVARDMAMIAAGIGTDETITQTHGTFADYLATMAQYMGYGRSPSANDLLFVKQKAWEAYQEFLRPTMEDLGSWEWPFLTGAATITLAASDSTYDLPTDFGAMVDDMLYSVAPYAPTKIQFVPEGMVRNLLAQNSTYTGYPLYAAIRAKAQVAGAALRYEMVTYPASDAIYTLTYRYKRSVTLSELSTTTNYVLGYPDYYNALLAVAKMHADRTPQNEKVAMAALRAAVLDDANKSPAFVGSLGGSGYSVAVIPDSTLTYDGVLV